MSSRGAGRSPRAARTGVVHDLLRRRAGGAAQHIGEILRRPHPLGRPGLREAVRVEHDRVAGPQLARAVVQLRPLHEAEQGAGRAQLLDGAVRPYDRGQRVPAAGNGRSGRRAGEVQVQAGDRAEPSDQLGRLLAEHRLAEQAQDRRRGAPPDRRRPDRVARHGGHRGRLGALAADVADDRVPLLLGSVEDVVEVAAHLRALAGGAVQRRKLEPRHVGQGRRQ